MRCARARVRVLFSGHWRLKRITLGEREEQRKRDRDLDRSMRLKREKESKDEEEVDRSSWCKYTLGIKHQVGFENPSIPDLTQSLK